VLICNYYVALVCNVWCPLVATWFPCALQKQKGVVVCCVC
jgi:hypothetical protein